ncbi:hypothetical protein [Sphingomonas hylomeconis]|uniref:Uncharacterized protein n=1 Tax=Sphingomonas hylomeconis TaxID=1395958 RepID=A0ABV7ST02_9SPHN|nr:hypothetical protein [Sphingomonas hylomeconis]
MPREPHDTPTKASAEHGEVMLDGPAGLAASMTPRAARASAEAIGAAADEAEGQAAVPRPPREIG